MIVFLYSCISYKCMPKDFIFRTWFLGSEPILTNKNSLFKDIATFSYFILSQC